MTRPILIVGAIGSPYTRKMKALARYRRIEIRFLSGGPGGRPDGLPKPPLPLLPVVYLPEGENDYRATSDSTFQLRELETRYTGRSVLPPDPVIALLDYLVEDYADEWVTKMMFHYRWYYAADRAFARTWIITSRDPVMAEAERRAGMQAFNDRQVGRMALVGCTEQNRPLIEESYRFVLDTVDRHVRAIPFLFGARPSLADFGLFGQLQILSVDPTPMAEMRERAPDVYCWLLRLDDASGVEGEWIDPAAPLPGTLTALLRHCGETYLPFLAANTRALQEGRDEVALDILGRPYAQAPFRYQGKCHDALRRKLAALPGEVRHWLDPVLEQTGCLRYLA
jgi:glutathione S-transferase